jgi:predicted phage terminase large subunit-like protein
MAKSKKVKIKRPSFGPSSEKQRLVLLENEVDIHLTGGGAGSGKSFLSLLKAVKLVEDPAAKVMVLRLSYPMLKDLISASKQIYPHFGGVYKAQARTWIFPNGAEIDFKAMPKDLLEVQGWERTTYIVDEAAEFKLEDILAIFSRLRSATYKGKMSMLLTCNPNKTSYLLDFVQFSLDQDGIPLAGTEDKIRYFCVQNSHVKWADSAEELYEKYGNGLKLGVEFVPMKFKFTPMLCYDNKVLMKADPGYPGRLLSQPRVNQLRLLYGSWYAAVSGSTMVTEDMFEVVDHPPINPVAKIWGWDLAASIPNEANQFKCDWTVGVLMSKDSLGNFYVENVVRFQKQIDGVLKGIRDTAWECGLDVTHVIPCDPGQAGKVASKFYITFLAENGISTRVEGSNPHANKATRFGPFASVSANKSVKIVRGEWNRIYFDEICFFTGKKGDTDDQADATSSAFNQLARQCVIPVFSLPTFTTNSPIPKI